MAVILLINCLILSSCIFHVVLSLPFTELKQKIKIGIFTDDYFEQARNCLRKLNEPVTKCADAKSVNISRKDPGHYPKHSTCCLWWVQIECTIKIDQSICNLTEQDQLKTFIGYYIEYYNQEYCQEYEYHDKEWKCFSNGWVTNTPDYSQSTPEYTATRRPHPDPDDSHTINKVIVKEL